MAYEDNELNERIAVYRRLAGYSQAEAAKKLGMSKSTYAKKEKDGIIDCKLLVEISKLFCVDVGDLLLNGSQQIYDGSKLHLTFQDEQLIRVIHSLSHENQLKIKKFIYRIYTENKTD